MSQKIPHGKIIYTQIIGKQSANAFLFFDSLNAIYIIEQIHKIDSSVNGYAIHHVIKHKDIIKYSNEKFVKYASLWDNDRIGKRGLGIENDSLANSFRYYFHTPTMITISYIDETKLIAGFKCQKALIVCTIYNKREQKFGERKYSIFFTPTINNIFSEFKGLNGLPLEYEYQMGTQTILVRADEVTEMEVLANQFDLNSLYPDYNIKTMTENEVENEAQKAKEAYQQSQKAPKKLKKLYEYKFPKKQKNNK